MRPKLSPIEVQVEEKIEGRKRPTDFTEIKLRDSVPLAFGFSELKTLQFKEITETKPLIRSE